MLKFKVDTDRLTFGDLLSLESGKMASMVETMARCLTDDAGEYVPQKEAEKTIKAIPLSDLKDVIGQFSKAMEAFKDGAVPPTGGGK